MVNCVCNAIQNTCGRKQGDPLSALLFSVFIGDFEICLPVKSPHVGVQMGQELVQMALYAQDMVLLSSKAPQLQQILDILHEFYLAN
jgi:hypothetical protein